MKHAFFYLLALIAYNIYAQQIDTVYLTDNDFIVDKDESDYFSIIKQTENQIIFNDFYNKTDQKAIRTYLNEKGKLIPPQKIYKYNFYNSLIENGEFYLYSKSGILYEKSIYSHGENIEGPYYFDSFGDTIECDFEDKLVKKPTFNGDDSFIKFRDFISENLIYPKEASKNRIQGKVFVQFVINKNGKVELARILSGIDSSLNNEAIRVIELSPNWTPAEKNGEKKSCLMTMPIDFKL